MLRVRGDNWLKEKPSLLNIAVKNNNNSYSEKIISYQQKQMVSVVIASTIFSEMPKEKN